MLGTLVNRTVANLLPLVPRPLVWRISRRYIAGETLADALGLIQSLNARGLRATLDVLGEDTEHPRQVTLARDLYLEALEQIEGLGLDCNVSVKLSQLGLRLDPDLTRSVLAELTRTAAARGNFVRIDMEDSTVTDATLETYRHLRQDCTNVGIVLQACLKRTPADLESLLAENHAHVRLCKGIYIEPEAIAWRQPQQVSAAYRSLLERLLDGGAEKTAIATHDPALLRFALDLIERMRPARERYEFQMLLGVAEDLRDELLAAGHPVRIYVPFGEHWYAYSSRRLRENPAIAGHVMRNLLPRTGGDGRLG